MSGIPDQWMSYRARRIAKAAARFDKPLKKEREALREHRCACIRYLADQMADQLSETDEVSARRVLDLLEPIWPGECKAELAKGRE